MARTMIRLLVILIFVVSFTGVRLPLVSAGVLPEDGLPPLSLEDPNWVAPADWEILPASSPQIYPLDAGEGQPDPNFSIAVEDNPEEDLVPKADRTVGPGCTYPTIAAAITAANAGDRLLLAGNVTFAETLVISKNLTIQGGYAGCAGGSAARTIVDGSTLNRVFNINAASVTLQNLTIQNANTTGEGGGVQFGMSVPGVLTINNTEIKNNQAAWGGGVWIGDGSSLTTNNVQVRSNIATTYGGGIRLYGATASLQDSSIFYNISARGGGIMGSIGTGHASVLTMSGTTLVYQNSVNSPGQGAGIYFDQGQVNVSGTSRVAFNGGIQGGGVYLNNNATFTLSGAEAAVDTNTATEDGGGIYAVGGSIVNLMDGGSLLDNSASLNGGGIFLDASELVMAGNNTSICINAATGNGGGVYLGGGSSLTATSGKIGCTAEADYGNTATYGAGIYSISSNINFQGTIQNNKAGVSGGAIYALGGVFSLRNVLVGGTGANEANWLTGTNGFSGPGIFLKDVLAATLDATTISNNKWTTTSMTYGGGLYLWTSTATLQNGSLVDRHNAPSLIEGRGGGIYLNSSTLTLDNSIVRNNIAQLGGGIRVFNSSVLNIRNGSWVDHNFSLEEGGGIAIGADAGIVPDVNVENSTLQYNHSSKSGGAVYMNAGTLDFTGWWDVRWNSADEYGGAFGVTGTGDVDFYAGGTSYLAVNSATMNGGGIYLGNQDVVSLHAILGSRINFNTNSAGQSGGGGYANGGGLFDLYGDLQMTSNSAGSNGGLIYLTNSSRLWIDDYGSIRPQVWVNHATNGGSIYASASTVELDGVDFGMTNNGSYTTAGSGGVISSVNSTLNMDNCHFTNNRAVSNGGAIYAVNSTVTIASSMSPSLAFAEIEHPDPKATNCNPYTACSAFYNNLADSDGDNVGNGGAIYISGGTMNMQKTHLHDNHAYRGGAIFQANSTAITTLNNVLIYKNSTAISSGAGIRTEGGSFYVNHGTFADNTNGAAFSTSATFSQITNSIAYGNTLGFVGDYSALSTCNIDQAGTIGIIVISSPFLGGGNYHLSANSLAIDACTTGLERDLNNRVRPIGLRYDMGVYEGGYYAIFLPLLSR